MQPDWLERLFLEADLEPAEAEVGARQCLLRLLDGPHKPLSRHEPGILGALSKDPLASVNRILGRGDLGLPLHDPDTGRLSVTSLADALNDAGLDPVVAMAHARLFVEVVDPEDFYGPVWQALGGKGPVELDALAKMDWSVLRGERTVKASVPSPAVRAPRAPKKG